MAGKVPSWESELWSYLSSGDGEHCPAYNSCENRKKGGWCPSNNVDRITRLLDEGHFDLGKYDSIGSGECGRVFQLVGKIAEQFLKKGGVHRPPVPNELVSLADAHHPIEIRLVPLKVYHSAIWHLREGWIIQLSKDDELGRKRFSLFHEVFHILAHSKTTPVFRKVGCTQGCFNELLADYFGGCILMPTEWVTEKWVEVKDLDRMVEIFDVTKPLMWLRLREIGLI